jgi:hypothetical protein
MQINVNHRLYLASSYNDFVQDPYCGHYKYSLQSFDTPIIKDTLREDREPGWRSRRCDSLQAGRSGDPIPVETRFASPVQTGSAAHPASGTMGTGSLYQGVNWLGRGIGPSTYSRG